MCPSMGMHELWGYLTCIPPRLSMRLRVLLVRFVCLSPSSRYGSDFLLAAMPSRSCSQANRKSRLPSPSKLSQYSSRSPWCGTTEPDTDREEQIRHLLELIRKSALFSSQPPLPTTWRRYERFLRWRGVLLRRGVVVPPASQDGHSRYRVAELRAGSQSYAW